MFGTRGNSAQGEWRFQHNRQLRKIFLDKKVTLGALVGLASLLHFVASCSGSEPSTYQPNIIFVLTDDLDFASAQKMPEVRSQLIEEGLNPNSPIGALI